MSCVYITVQHTLYYIHIILCVYCVYQYTHTCIDRYIYTCIYNIHNMCIIYIYDVYVSVYTVPTHILIVAYIYTMCIYIQYTHTCLTYTN